MSLFYRYLLARKALADAARWIRSAFPELANAIGGLAWWIVTAFSISLAIGVGLCLSPAVAKIIIGYVVYRNGGAAP